ncbi:MAG: putative toxin-antitoxin system toxin component, PIN family [Candidatus Kuenenbacteria bacterium]
MIVIIDTNILIDAWQDDFSYPRRIMDEVMKGNMRAVASNKIIQENKLILDRLVNDQEHCDLVNKFFGYVEVIPVNKRVNVVKYDKDDNKFLECAEEAGANYIISNDSHLWEIGEYKGIKILKPEDFWAEYQGLEDDGQGEWNEWMKGILK